MIFRIRVILDVEEDVLRDIEIEAKSTLKDLHEVITKSFGLASAFAYIHGTTRKRKKQECVSSGLSP